VHETIKRLRGTMPEDLPTPKENIQQLQRKEEKCLKQSEQPSLFEKQAIKVDTLVRHKLCFREGGIRHEKL
jgi:hypothetical protein